MWDEYGFNGNVNDVDSGVQNIRKGVAKIMTNEASAEQASFNVDTEFGDLAGAIARNSLASFIGLATPNSIDGPPFENILEQFASYTPLWTLCCLSPDQFNNPYLYRGLPGALENVVFSSAGRYDGQRAETIVGAPEYYVNNFSMDMTTAATEKTGSTNMINMSFDVYEPYSMGYFIHSLQTAAINAGYPSYNGTPYLLKLEFAGYKDNGQMFGSTDALEKYFVIQLKKVTFSTNESGSNYKCEATPYHHTGFTNIAQQVPMDLKLRGEDIKEMLISGESSLCVTLNRDQVKKAKELTGQSLPDKYIVVFPENWADRVGLPGDGIDGSWSEDEGGLMTYDPTLPISAPLVGRKGQDSLDYGVGVIGTSSLGFGPSSGGNLNFGFEADVTDEETGLIKRGELRIDPKQREFQFNKGVTIQNVIQEVILSSEYAKDAIDPKNIDDETGRLSWFRVDVQIVIGEFDSLRNARQRTYIFRVLPFKVHASVFRAPTTNPKGYPMLNKIIGKEYKYIYTGQNNDIIKFDIQINQLFHAGAQITNSADSESVANAGNSSADEKADQQQTSVTSGNVATATTPDASPSYGDFAMTKITTKGGPGAQDVARRTAEILKNKILKQGTGDMTKLSLEIIGDPYWISDSGMGNYLGDIYDGPNAGLPGEDAMREKGGSLNYQGTDTYIRVIFRTPVEPNLGTSGQGGLYNFPPGEKINPYSGIYKVIRCNNKFSDGKFTQTLECTRMPNQPWDYDPYDGPSPTDKQLAIDISKQDTIDLSPNGDMSNDVDYSDLFGIDAGGLGPGYTDEEIAQNNADLGDFMG
jgi:hypothetical protein